MDLAPKQSKTQDSSTLKSTAESRLKNFMQEVTGRALVMMESATQNQQGYRHGFGARSLYFITQILFRSIYGRMVSPVLYHFNQQITGLAS